MTMKLTRRILATLTLTLLPGAWSSGCGGLEDGLGEEVPTTTVQQASTGLEGTSFPCSLTTPMTDYPSVTMIEGYSNLQSYGPSDDIRLYVSARLQRFVLPPLLTVPVTATYYRLTSTKPISNVGELRAIKSTSASYQKIPYQASECGARWLETSGLGVSAAEHHPTDGGAPWPSGLYVAKLTIDGVSGTGSAAHRFYVPFIIRDAAPAEAVLVAATNTWAAYNAWPGPNFHVSQYPADTEATKSIPYGYDSSGVGGKGHSYYIPSPGCDAFGADSQQSCTVNLRRPLGSADPALDTLQGFGAVITTAFPTVPIEREGIDWLSRKAATLSPPMKFSMVADSDDAVISQLDANTTKMVILSGHNEYVTSNMRSALDGYLKRGGHVLNLAGNTMNWQVEYVGPNHDQMRTYKAEPFGTTPPYKDWQSCPSTTHAEFARNSDVLGTLTAVPPNVHYSLTNDPSKGGDPAHWAYWGTPAELSIMQMGTHGDFTNSKFGSTPNPCGGFDCTAFSSEIDTFPGIAEKKPYRTKGDETNQIIAGLYETTSDKIDGIGYTGKPHSGGVFSAGAIGMMQSLDSGATDATDEPVLSSVVLNAIKRFRRAVPVANGDITGKTGTDEDFQTDFYCHGPAGSGSSSGKLFVAAARSTSSSPLNLVPIPNSTTSWTTSWCSGTGDKIGFADLNGDRKVDTYCYHTTTSVIDVALSNGANAFSSVGTWATGVNCSSSGSVLTTGDVNGDGRHDLVCMSGAGVISVAVNAGTIFGALTTWYASFGGSGAVFGSADMNGDGLDDVWSHFNTGAAAGATFVLLSNGSNQFENDTQAPFGSHGVVALQLTLG